MKNVTLLVFSFFLVSTAFAEKKIVNSKITEVTVYPVGAMINRQVQVRIPKGENFIVLDNLTTIIDPNTIQVGGNGDFEISSVKFEFFYPYESSKPEKITAIHDTLKVLDDELFLLLAEDESLENERVLILINKNLSSETGTRIADVKEMAEYFRTRFANISKEKLRIQNRSKEIYKEKRRLQSIMDGMNNYVLERVGRIILETRTEKLVMATIKFSYFTPSASWFPKYNIKANSGTEHLEVDYHALVKQSTGIDWDNVNLTLSTSRPNLNNQKPVLHPWYLDFYSNYAVKEYRNRLIDKGNTAVTTTGSEEDYRNMVVRSASNVAKNTAGVYSNDGGTGGLNIRGARVDANYYYIDGMKIQGSSELPNSGISTSNWDVYGNYNYPPAKAKYSSGELVFNALNLSYKIDDKYSVMSNNTQKQVFIKNVEIPTKFGHYAVPSMETESFLTASITNWGEFGLIPGNATLFYNNTYVGRSFILSNTVDDTLRVSLGRDHGVLIKRELIQGLSTTKKAGNNLKKKFVYEITIKNTNRGAVEIVLFDQVPVTKRSGIIVNVGETAGAKYTKETGMLKWKKEIPAGGKITIQFDYEVKYPKGKTINL